MPMEIGYDEIGESYGLDSGYSMGEEDFVGDEVEAILGAMPRPRRGMQRMARPQRRAQRPGPGQSVVRYKEPTKSRQYPLGFDSVAAVAAAATVNVTNNPQVLFRPDRLVVPQTIAPNFLINSLTVGKNNQFAAAGAIAAETCSQTSFGVQLHCDTAQVNAAITLNVTNIALAGSRFLATIFGEAIE